MEAQDRWAYYAKKPDVSECEDDTRWITVVESTERTALNLKKYKCKTQKFFLLFFFSAAILWNLLKKIGLWNMLLWKYSGKVCMCWCVSSDAAARAV